MYNIDKQAYSGGGFASGFLALQSALGFRAVLRLAALPVTFSFLANRRADRLWSLAGRVALGRRTHGLALGARFLLAHVLRASHRARGFLAVHSALGARCFLALHLAARSLTHWVAYSRAHGIITLPATFGVALSEAAQQQRNRTNLSRMYYTPE